jgi:hypothetical protein
MCIVLFSHLTELRCCGDMGVKKQAAVHRFIQVLYPLAKSKFCECVVYNHPPPPSMVPVPHKAISLLFRPSSLSKVKRELRYSRLKRALLSLP